MEVSDQYCTFLVDDLFFGVPVANVQEVLRYQEMTSVPLSPDVVEGLINLRGQIVTAIDVRRRLALSKRSSGDLPMNVVLTDEHGSVSLLVDEIGDVLEVDCKSLEKPPDTLDPSVRELIRGVYKLEGRLLLELDPARAVDLTGSEVSAG